MGDYSHYCNVSRITIRPNNKCVLIPLRDTTESTIALDWVPATLPIFGTYTGYGSLEDVEQDANTDIIVKRYCTEINLFTEHLMRQGYSEGREYPGLEGWMLVDRTVWDEMTATVFETRSGYDHDLGNKHLLTHLGFKFLDSIKPQGVRYHYRWTLDDKILYSDGTWCQLGPDINDPSIYGLLELADNFPSINPDYLSLMSKTKAQSWRIYAQDYKILDRNLAFCLGLRDFFEQRYGPYAQLLPKDKLDMSLSLEEQLAKLPVLIEQDDVDLDADEPSEDAMKIWTHNARVTRERALILAEYSCAASYLSDLNTFGDDIAKLDTLLRNLRVMSLSFEPQVQNYITPQYGAYESHAKILDIFSRVNASYCRDADEDDDW
jgi:hypothetical protein